MRSSRERSCRPICFWGDQRPPAANCGVSCFQISKGLVNNPGQHPKQNLYHSWRDKCCRYRRRGNALVHFGQFGSRGPFILHLSTGSRRRLCRLSRYAPTSSVAADLPLWFEGFQSGYQRQRRRFDRRTAPDPTRRADLRNGYASPRLQFKHSIYTPSLTAGWPAFSRPTL